MPAAEWTEDLSVGVAEIDNDHKLLISLMNQLQDAVDDGENKETVGSVLNSLIDYTIFHFEREELLMEACGYPDLEAHREFHAKLQAKSINIRNAYLSNPDAVLGERVMEFLTGWLTHHIRGTDKAYEADMAADPGAVTRGNVEFLAAFGRLMREGDEIDEDVEGLY